MFKVPIILFHSFSKLQIRVIQIWNFYEKLQMVTSHNPPAITALLWWHNISAKPQFLEFQCINSQNYRLKWSRPIIWEFARYVRLLGIISLEGCKEWEVFLMFNIWKTNIFKMENYWNINILFDLPQACIGVDKQNSWV